MESAGLPETSKPASPLDQGFVVIGKLRRPHGIHGDMLFEIMTDYPERIVNGKRVFIGEEFSEKIIVDARNHHVGLIVHLEGYDTPEDCGDLRNKMVYVPITELPELPAGEVYHHDLIGMSVVTATGELIGVLLEIMETGANDVLIVRDADGNETLLPDIESVVLAVNLEEKQIVVQPPEWL